MGRRVPSMLRFVAVVLVALCVEHEIGTADAQLTHIHGASFITDSDELKDPSRPQRGVGSPMRVRDAAPGMNDHGRLAQEEVIATSYSADEFWKAYSEERHALLSRGTGGGEQSPSTKYLVFYLRSSGLGNHMVGLMSAFALSIALGRVFLHDWNERRPQCGAAYDDLFVPPFSPWSVQSEPGTLVSGVDRLLPGAGMSTEDAEHRWEGLPPFANPAEKEKCTINLQHSGVAGGGIDMVFMRMKGQDPMPECRVLTIISNQYLVQAVADPGYGAPNLGGVPLSQWLGEGSTVETLFAGLFRPVESVSRRVVDAAAQLYPSTGQTMAAHARAWRIGTLKDKREFLRCLHGCAQQNNASTIVIATDMAHFIEDAGVSLRPDGIAVKALAGVSRTGESAKMRNTVDQVQTALVEMLLIGKADVVVTSHHSSFSSIAAATGGLSTKRVGGVRCKPIPNEPELHVLECGMPWKLNKRKWESVYSFLKSNRERCFG